MIKGKHLLIRVGDFSIQKIRRNMNGNIKCFIQK